MQVAINNTFESAGTSKVCDFRIDSNGIMIKALTSRLYSNPIASIVRELASNALDACPTRPMEITIPSYLDPVFRIRDFGPGLSLSDMVNVFCRFGESTKRNSNSQIGGFGLGAKSPFALVDTFTIISRHGGTKTSYLAAIGSNGIPELHQVASEPCDDTGLTIEIPSADTYSFKAALSQIQFFKPAPIVNGTPIEAPSVLFDDPAFCILDQKIEPGVLLGPVYYPLSPRVLNSTPNVPALLKYDIGTLEVTASREEIVYNDTTLPGLRSRYDAAAAIYRSQIMQIIDKATSAETLLSIIKGYAWSLSHTRPDGIEVSDYGINVKLHGLIPKRQRKLKRWTFSHMANTAWHADDAVILVDEDTTGFMKRLQTYAQANTLPQVPSASSLRNILLVTDPLPLDTLSIPYVRLSSLPKPSRKYGSPKSYRTFDGSKFVVTTEVYSHYLQLDANKLSFGQSVTPTLIHAITEQLGFKFYVLPHNFKGKLDNLTDIVPLLKAKFDKWVDDNRTALEVSGGDRYSHDVISRRGLIECLGDLSFLPKMLPEPEKPLAFSWFYPDIIGYSWNTSLLNLYRTYPLLEVCAESRHKDLPKLVNLIVKG
jgi:hypothetical protein